MNAWDQIKYFKPEEFDSPDQPGSGLQMNIEFIKLLDDLRAKAGIPLKINSGIRSVEHNRAVGGVPNSAHVKGCACDIAIEDGRQRFDIVRAALEIGFQRIGVGDTLIHLDMDFDLPQRVLWTYSLR